MSAGHQSVKPQPRGSKEYDAHTDFVRSLLNNEKFVSAIEGYTKDSAEYDVPFLAGSNNAGDTIYYDRAFFAAVKAGKVHYDGKPYNPLPYVRVHEAVEGAAIRLLGTNYDTDNKLGLPGGHLIATWAERRAVEDDGLDWAKHQASMETFIEAAEHERVKNPPPDLLTQPYKGTKQDKEVEPKEGSPAEEAGETPAEEAAEQAQGGYAARKLTHAEVNYKHARAKAYRCATCRHFQKSENEVSCEIVESPISPNGWCDRFVKGN